jgi:hypothetical protein
MHGRNDKNQEQSCRTRNIGELILHATKLWRHASMGMEDCDLYGEIHDKTLSKPYFP